MRGGDASIAAQSTFPRKQACLLVSEVGLAVERTEGDVVCRVQSFVVMSNNRNFGRRHQGRWKPCLD